MARELTIMELQDILKRLKAGHSIKQITRETGTHRSVIRKLKNIALNTDWFREDAPLPSEKELHDAYYGAMTPTPHVLDAFRDELMEYHTSGVSYTVMHQLLQGRATVSERTLRRYVQTKIEPSIPRATVKRRREMSIMEVDFGSAAMDRLVHRAVKIVIEGKSYRLDSFAGRNQLSGLTNAMS